MTAPGGGRGLGRAWPAMQGSVFNEMPGVGVSPTQALLPAEPKNVSKDDLGTDR